jgi:hypothetical protein
LGTSSKGLLVAAAALALAACGAFNLGPDKVPASAARACSDGVDGDGDGRTDFPDDPGCESELDPDENDPGTPRACSDGQDNDADGRVDFDQNGDGVVGREDDPGCESAADDDEYNVVLPACGDGIDNDGDLLVDFPADLDCQNRNDTSEAP